uniref:16S rRNA aminocarboxypropyltransferase n=1 Tax=uncultured marine thaumarchaeote AD1000_21_E03 TaxID=1455900 RepID=A0A075FL36_9ARCH|nr:pre-rRNA-processing protein (TSR3) [uncultured marine thaumarchaeote AD1000_21_E03]
MNYSKLNKLSTVEALAGAVYILGEPDLTHTLLKKFKWGNTFFELNKNLLQDYSKAQSESEILEICHEYGLANAQFT